MSNLVQNLIILCFCWAVATASGVYVTFFDQPGEMERLDNAEKVARMKQVELSSLMAEMEDSAGMAGNLVNRWNARYKIVPQALASEEVIRYLNELTQTGFQPFDISFDEHEESPDFSKYVFDITGKGEFSSVYNLIWSLENSRILYLIQDLEMNHFDLITMDAETQRQKMNVVVEFSFTLEAFYGGIAGLSAHDELQGGLESALNASDPVAGWPVVPIDVLPARYAVMNPFHPLILEKIPPNTFNLVNLEKASLNMIVGTQAILEWEDELISIGVGDPVYLGQVISVDPRHGTMIARLNKGGIMDEVVLTMEREDLYKQAQGQVQLSPNQQ